MSTLFGSSIVRELRVYGCLSKQWMEKLSRYLAPPCTLKDLDFALPRVADDFRETLLLFARSRVERDRRTNTVILSFAHGEQELLRVEVCCETSPRKVELFVSRLAEGLHRLVLEEAAELLAKFLVLSDLNLDRKDVVPTLLWEPPNATYIAIGFTNLFGRVRLAKIPLHLWEPRYVAPRSVADREGFEVPSAVEVLEKVEVILGRSEVEALKMIVRETRELWKRIVALVESLEKSGVLRDLGLGEREIGVLRDPFRRELVLLTKPRISGSASFSDLLDLEEAVRVLARGGQVFLALAGYIDDEENHRTVVLPIARLPPREEEDTLEERRLLA